MFFWTFYLFGSCFRTLAIILVSDFVVVDTVSYTSSLLLNLLKLCLILWKLQDNIPIAICSLTANTHACDHRFSDSPRLPMTSNSPCHDSSVFFRVVQGLRNYTASRTEPAVMCNRRIRAWSRWQETVPLCLTSGERERERERTRTRKLYFKGL